MGIAEEAERIRKKNGRVFALRDEPRNYRVWLPNDNFPGLAMARAFGDLQLKNYGIIAVPQVSYHLLTSRDQFIVLATDGVKHCYFHYSEFLSTLIKKNIHFSNAGIT